MPGHLEGTHAKTGQIGPIALPLAGPGDTGGGFHVQWHNQNSAPRAEAARDWSIAAVNVGIALQRNLFRLDQPAVAV
jgi:hypothetical protein